MWKLLKRTKGSTVRFSDRCGRVCDDACRRSALRERVLLQQVWRGVA
jgi:hypothetical protein